MNDDQKRFRVLVSNGGEFGAAEVTRLLAEEEALECSESWRKLGRDTRVFPVDAEGKAMDGSFDDPLRNNALRNKVLANLFASFCAS